MWNLEQTADGRYAVTNRSPDSEEWNQFVFDDESKAEELLDILTDYDQCLEDIKLAINRCC